MIFAPSCHQVQQWTSGMKGFPPFRCGVPFFFPVRLFSPCPWFVPAFKPNGAPCLTQLRSDQGCSGIPQPYGWGPPDTPSRISGGADFQVKFSSGTFSEIDPPTLPTHTALDGTQLLFSAPSLFINPSRVPSFEGLSHRLIYSVQDYPRTSDASAIFNFLYFVVLVCLFVCSTFISESFSKC